MPVQLNIEKHIVIRAFETQRNKLERAQSKARIEYGPESAIVKEFQKEIALINTQLAKLVQDT